MKARIARWLRRALVASLLLVAAAVLGAWALLGTTAGSTWVLREGARIAGVQSDFSALTGSLLDRLEIENLEVISGDIRLDVDRLTLHWRPTALLESRALVHELAVNGVDLVLPETPPEPGEVRIEVPELPTISLPLAIDVEHLELTELRLGGAGSEPLLERLQGAISARGNELIVHRLAVNRDALEAGLAARLTLDGDWPVDATLTATGRKAELDIDARVSVSGSVRAPVIALTASAPFRVDADASADLREHPPTATLALRWEALRLPDVPATSPGGALTAEVNAREFELSLDTVLDGAPGDVTRVVLDASGTLASFIAPFPFDARATWKVNALDHTFAGSGNAAGDAGAITLEHVLERPFSLTTAGEVQPAGSATRIALSGEWRNLAWPPTRTPAPETRPQTKQETQPAAAAGNTAGSSSRSQAAPSTTTSPGSPSGRYSFAGTLDGFTAELEAALAGVEGVKAITAKLNGAADAEAPNPFKAAITWTADTIPAGPVAGKGTVDGDSEAIRFDHQLTGPGVLDTRGRVVLAPQPDLDVTGTLSVARWPLTGDPQASRVDASFSLRGGLDALATRIAASLETAAAGPLALEGDAVLSADGARDLAVALDVLDGSVTTTGSVSWAETPGAVLTLEARALNPGRLQPQAAGKVNARLAADITAPGGEPRGSIVLERLDGTLGGYPISGEGRVNAFEGGYEALGVALRSGENTLALSGRVTDILALDLDLEAPDLKQLWPGLEGAVRGSGVLAGTPTQPTITAKLTANGVSAGDIRVDSASVDADVNLDARSTVTIRAAGIRSAGTTVEAVSVDLEGTTAAHELALDAKSSEGTLALRASGGLGDENWSGRIQELRATGTALGDWVQREPWQLKVGADGASSDEACLASDDASLCVRALEPGNDVQQLTVKLASLPVSRFSPWLGSGLAINGDINAQASASRRGAGAWEADATVTPSPIRITLAETAPESAPEKALEFVLEEARLEARHDASGSRAELTSRIGSNGSLNGQVSLGPMSEASPALRGRLQASLPELTVFTPLVPALNELAGRLEAALDLAGTLDAPRAEGTLALTQTRAGIIAAGITVEDVALRLKADSNGSFDLEGGARSGPGSLSLSGNGRIDGDAVSARVSLKGENFEAVKLIPVQAQISPDLTVEATPTRIGVTGTLHVPEASVTIEEVPPNVVAVSDDEVIVGAQEEAASKLRQSLDVKVDLTLGDKVSISAFGLDTRLEGGLAIAVAGASPPTGRGTVSLKDGRFTAYSQDLEVRRGRLLFAGPLDNPGLDVRAVRDAGEVVAGIELFGTAASLQSRVFSEPPLPQAEALSWLLTGRGLSGASQSDGSVLAGAALALGLERSDQVTREIGSSLGLDELSVESGGSLEESSLVLGKALTPRLFIRYALGVLDREGTLKLDYKLTDRISLEAESGEHQAADVLYRLER